MGDRQAPLDVPVLDLGGGAFADALTETTQALVCVLDRDGRILLFNEACERATGYARDEVLGRDAREVVIPPEEVEAFGGVLDEVWATGLPSPQVGHWLCKDGERLLVAWSNKPVPGGDGTPAYLVTTGLDVTQAERDEAERRALQGDLEAKLAEVGRLARLQAALRRVATLVAAEAPSEAVFRSVSEESARVLGQNAAAVFRFEPEGTATVVGRYDRDGIDAFPLGATIPLDPLLAIGRVHTTGRPARIDDYSGLDSPGAMAMRQAGLRSTVAAPVVVGGEVWGAAAVTSRTSDRLPPESEARLGAFCELASLAVESSHTREELRASRARIVHAADQERQRLERNLHDGAQQRLVALGIALRLARRRLASDPDTVAQLLDTAIVDLDEATTELRELARGLHPAVLSQSGIAPAITSLANRAPVPVQIAELPQRRLPEAVEVAAYYVVAEALTNVARHAEATGATVSIRHTVEEAHVEVRDDGRGGADAGGSGLVGLQDRVDALGGTLTVSSPPGNGTVVRARLPLA